jgi:hypothetical protein
MQVTLIKLPKFISSLKILKANQMFISYFSYITHISYKIFRFWFMIHSVTKSWVCPCIGKCESPITKTTIRYFVEIILSTVCKRYLKNTMLHDWHVCFQNISSSTRRQTALSEPNLLQCRSLMITLRHTTLGRNPLDEWSDRRRDLYLTSTFPGGVPNRSHSKRVAANANLKPRCPWDRL